MNATLQTLALTPRELQRAKALGLILPFVAPPATPSQLAGTGAHKHKKGPNFVRAPETIEREARRARSQLTIGQLQELARFRAAKP